MKNNNKIICLLMGALLFALSFWAWFKDSGDFSLSERRKLAQFPKLSMESLSGGEFMDGFESYAQDQFPLREGFRSLKCASELGLFLRADKDGLYLYEGHIAQMNYPLNEDMLSYAAGRMEYIYNTYLAPAGSKVYLAIIPEKGFFTEGRLQLDYEALCAYMRERTEYMSYIPIAGSLSLDSYYTTDSHWRQEKILETAELINHAMGSPCGAYELVVTDYPFYGVYAGQLGLKGEPDTLKYLTNDSIEGCTVTSYDSGKPQSVPFYDLEAAAGRDPYEMFLNGADALLVIENPAAETDRELIIFRDSFGSSLAPLLLEGYSKVTLVDIRYIRSDMLGRFIEFKGQDVLFIYSSMLLNNSLALK